MTDCPRCKDWERMGLSATCPTCDQRIIEMPTMTIAEHTIKHQAAEIKRLEAELEAERRVNSSLDGHLCNAHAQLAEVVTALRKIEGLEATYEAPMIAHKALTTDGKAASDVLAAADDCERIRGDYDDFDGDRRGIASALHDAEQRLYDAVRAYRKEGQGNDPA